MLVMHTWAYGPGRIRTPKYAQSDFRTGEIEDDGNSASSKLAAKRSLWELQPIVSDTNQMDQVGSSGVETHNIPTNLRCTEHGGK